LTVAYDRNPGEERTQRPQNGIDDVLGHVLGDEIGEALRHEKYDVRQSVLILDVKPVELLKWTTPERVLSVVRLQPLNDCLRTWVNPLESLVEFYRSIGTLFREDREPGLVGDGLGEAIPHVGHSKFEGEVVEGGSEVVDAVSDDEAKVSGRLFKHFEPRELVEVINIEIRPSSVRMFLAPGSRFSFKALQVVERPLEPPFVVESHGL
jgi:hypothetical protein